MLVASDGHHVGPIVWLHEDPSSMGAGHMEGSGAMLEGTLYTGTGHTLRLFMTVDTFLHGHRSQKHSAVNVRSKTGQMPTATTNHSKAKKCCRLIRKG